MAMFPKIGPLDIGPLDTISPLDPSLNYSLNDSIMEQYNCKYKNVGC